MNPVLVEFLLYFFGGITLTCLWITIHLVTAYHPYHKPIVPILSLSALCLLAVWLSGIISGDSLAFIDLIRESLAYGIVGLLNAIPFAYAAFLFFLLKASFRRRPEDPLLALLEQESS